MDFLAELLWKSSVLLALGGIAAVLLRRSSAATRHLIWSVTLGAALLLPLATLVVPPVHVAALPAPEPDLVVTAPVADEPAPPPIAVKAAAKAPWSQFGGPWASPARRSQTGAGAAQAWSERMPRGLRVPVALLGAFRAVVLHLDWTGFARLLWASATVLLLLRVGMGDLQLGFIARRARRVVDEEWLELLQQSSARLGLRRAVTLLESTDTEVPITWGSLHPRIVLPAAAERWTRAQKRAVLVHELAHVQRHDAFTQRLARLACALHWPNPLAWAAAAAMRSERERACDDRVIEDGALPTDYAASLLDVARCSIVPGRGRAALAMARRSQLEGRLISVLDPAVDRRQVNRRRAVTAAVAAACLALPLAAVRAERATPVTVAARPAPAVLPQAVPAVAP
ncbi:MAG TPA: M56 family metallopeptidase, partial [Myxococcales bacterium]|nr:M56 family metallopeptidase [Myxococcales bacterium]